MSNTPKPIEEVILEAGDKSAKLLAQSWDKAQPKIERGLSKFISWLDSKLDIPK